MNRFLFLAAAAALSLACGGVSDDPFDGGGDGGGDGATEASPDGAPDATDPFACGTTTCGGSEYCIHPCCGGAPPQCVPYEDGGTCPEGTEPSTTCWGGQDPNGCAPLPCKPPPPYCAPTAPSGGCGLQNGGHDCYEVCG